MHSSRVLAPALRVLMSGAVALALSCGPKPPTPVVVTPAGEVLPQPEPAREEDEAKAKELAAEAQRLDTLGDPQGAQAKRDLIVQSYPNTLAAADLFAARAQAAEQRGDASAAIESYEKLLFYRPNYPGADALRENYARLLLSAERVQDALNMLTALYRSAKDDAARLRLGAQLADALTQHGRRAAALEVRVDLYNAKAIGAAERQALATTIEQLAASGLSFQEAEEIWSKFGDDNDWAFIQPLLAFRLAKIYYHVRSYDRSEALLKLVGTRFPSSPYAAQAQQALSRLRARFEVNPRAVGVILPLSGRFKAFGERALQALQLAFKGSDIKVVVRDTQAEPAAASLAVEQLVLDEHVIAVIGPLFFTESMAAALKAEELSVPLLAMSYLEGLADVGPYVFRTALTIEAQARALAKTAFEKLGMARFVILHPNNTYGGAFAQAFWDEVEQRRGEVRGIESYEHDETTFQNPVRKLVGRYYKLARPEYRARVEEIRRERLPPHKRDYMIEQVDKSLAPVVDFDAIVIADSARNIGLIAPSLAFEDVITERDPKALERIRKATGRADIEPVTLLGGSTWNTPQTLESCDRYCEHAVFVDAFFPDSSDPAVRDFVAAFQEVAGAVPQLSEAQAFDTGALLRAVLDNSRPTTRAGLQSALLQAGPYAGITGTWRFDGAGEAVRELLTLTIQERAIRLWTPPPAELKN